MNSERCTSNGGADWKSALHVVFALGFFDLGDQLLDFFGVLGGADEGGLGGVDDDEVVAVDGGDEVGGAGGAGSASG